YISILIGISFCFAVTNSFIWNKKWTFKNKSISPKDLRKQIITFLVISLGGLVIKTYSASFVINNVQIVPLFNISETIWIKLWANVGNASAVLLTMIWNFVGYKLIVFKN
ncbi:GtrA family protein, partial [bacterium]